MLYAIVLYLDTEGQQRVRALWEHLGDKFLEQEVVQPHITLVLLDCDNRAEVVGQFEHIFSKLSVFEFQFDVLGSFPTNNVLHMMPTVTSRLLELQTLVHNDFKDWIVKDVEYYKPQHWVPHCTLAMGITKQKLKEAFVAMLEVWEPFCCCVDRAALIQVKPSIQEITTLPLS